MFVHNVHSLLYNIYISNKNESIILLLNQALDKVSYYLIIVGVVLISVLCNLKIDWIVIYVLLMKNARCLLIEVLYLLDCEAECDHLVYRSYFERCSCWYWSWWRSIRVKSCVDLGKTLLMCSKYCCQMIKGFAVWMYIRDASDEVLCF